MTIKRDKGLGKYKGTYLQTGTQEEKDDIDRKKHVAANLVKTLCTYNDIYIQICVTTSSFLKTNQ